MATNPMQKKTKTAFILGMLLMLIIAAIVVAFLYLQIKNQKEELKKYQVSSTSVYVLNQDVKSGQVLTPEMFNQIPISNNIIPSGATTDIFSKLSSYSLSTKDGRAIYYHAGTSGNVEDTAYYYIGTKEDPKRIYITGEDGKEAIAPVLKKGDKAYIYEQANNQGKTDIEISENAVVAKIDMTAKTVITNSLIAKSDEIITDDLRKEEYNVIRLPVDLAPEEYVDIRLRMPNGQDYIVVSKKRVSIPMVNGVYLDDTIQINLTEEEILFMSGAIVECYQTKGAELRAVRYTEAGIQDAAIMTYYPSSDVQKLLESDPNVVKKAINGILNNKNEIRRELDSVISKNAQEDDSAVSTKIEESFTSSKEARKNYLQTLTDASAAATTTDATAGTTTN